MFDDLNWYVLQTHPKQEERAAENLVAWNVETFVPKIKASRQNGFTGAVSYFPKPMFPRYIFAKVKINDLYHKIRFTRGIHSFVSFGDYPTPIDDDVIEFMRSRQGADGLVRLGDDLSQGDRVEIKDGPLRTFGGIFEREMKDSDRVMILLQTVNYQAHVVIEREQVRKIAKASSSV
jgi:transcriptional antiterminator RfaH